MREGARWSSPPVRPSAACSRRGPPASRGKEGKRRRAPQARAGGGAHGQGGHSSFLQTRPRIDPAPKRSPARAPLWPRPLLALGAFCAGPSLLFTSLWAQPRS